MKFNIQQSDLNTRISIAQKAISNRTSIQILDSIVFTAKGDELILTSTDLELSIETRVKCEIIEEGSVAIKSNLIGNIIRKMPENIISITAQNDNVNIKCQNSVLDIPCQSSEEYPNIAIADDEASLTIKNEDLTNAIKQTSFATLLNDDTRLALQGILFEVNNDEIKFVALDGYRMAIKKIKNNSKNVNFSNIVPRRAFTELIRIIDNQSTDIVVIEGHIAFINGNTKMYSRLIDKKYLDYKRIINRDYSTNIIVNRDDLISSLERASLIITSSNPNLTKFEFNNGVLNITSNSSIGNVDERLNTEQEGENLTIAFNTRYLLDGLKVIEDDQVILKLRDSLSPMTIYPINHVDEYLYLVLPIRLGK